MSTGVTAWKQEDRDRLGTCSNPLSLSQLSPGFCRSGVVEGTKRQKEKKGVVASH
jgi:hypothetical protein